MTKIIINGFKGRMGQSLLSCAAAMPAVQIVGQVDQGDDLSAIIGQCDAVIEFSFHNVTAGVVELCAKHGKALVIGTTGHNDAEKSQISSFKTKSPSSGPATTPPA